MYVRSKLDREVKDRYEMKIGAKNRETGDLIEEETTFYIIVEDVNDNEPLFDASEYTLEIKEHSTLGTEALRPKSDKSNPPSKYIFATDADLKSARPRSMEKCEVGTGNGDVTYKIIPENPLFKVTTCYDSSIDRFIAKIQLKSDQPDLLDRENPPKDLSFWLQAQDLGPGRPDEPNFKSEKVKINIKLVDINDYPPRFNNQTPIITKNGIKEDLPIGSEILRIPVIDEDEGINKAEPSEDFSEVIIRNAKKLDYEKKKDYEFTVTAYNTEPVVSNAASSSSLHARVQVRVFIENVDEPPEFKQKKTVLFIDENQPSGTKILNSANLAVDPEDDPFSYSLSDTNTSAPFQIDSKTGEISTLETLDYELMPSYQLDIVAKSEKTDSNVALQSIGRVEVNVRDLNDMKPRIGSREGSKTIKYCIGKQDWSTVVNFTDVDATTGSLIAFERDRKDKVWKGVSLKQNYIASKRILSVSVRSEDEDQFIQSGMTLPIGVSDGKYKENFDVIVQRCTCQGPNDNTECADYIQKPPILTAQIYWAVLIAVCFSILTIIGFAFWRNKTMEKPIDHPFKDNFEMSENDDERANVVEYNLQSGEQDCKQFYMTNKLPDIQEEPDILKLKEKLQSISNPYYIAPYDSLQLYHYEGTNSVVSSLSSINSYGSERSLNLSDMANNAKMSKLLKIFEARQDKYATVPRNSRVVLDVNENSSIISEI